jgi:hypothetical protein
LMTAPCAAVHCLHGQSISSAHCSMGPPPFQDVRQYFGCIIGRVELDALGQIRKNTEPVRIPRDRNHHFWRLNCVPAPLGTVSPGASQINS